jgi:hypothetical protein
MVKSSKEFFSPKTLIPPGPAGYSHIRERWSMSQARSQATRLVS